MKYAFRILLALLLCIISVGLVALTLPESFVEVQAVGGSAEVVSAERELPSVNDLRPSPISGSLPEEEPPASAESEISPAESSPASGAEEPSPSEPETPAPIPPQEPEAWMLRLVNWENPLPVDFEPEYEAVQNRFVMDKRVAWIVRQMIADAQTQGITLILNSAYRPYSAQQQVYSARYQKHLAEGRTEQEARWLTNSYVAIPGYSEHQLGLAMDIIAVSGGKRADSWLVDHAPEYGFILRYPEGKTEITHTAYESWHYRYVGVPTAREITDRGLCLEEYLAGR